MMTSINPKNVNMNNLQQNKVDIAPNPVNSLFQRNNYVNEGINSNLNYNQNLNINQMQQNKMYKNLNPELGGDMMKDMNMNNLNYNTQNNSINLNLGLQNKKNYSTPILNELPNTQNIQNQEKQDYNKSMDMYERNMQNNKNILNMNQPQNQGNNELYMAEIDRLKQEINDLKKNNEILGAQLKEEQRKNEQLFSIQKAKDENENGKKK